MGGNDKLEHDKETETQEQTPEVSDDGKKEENEETNKEQEKDDATKDTEISLSDLQKKIEVIKASDDYTKEVKEEAQIIANELTGNPNADQKELAEKAAKIAVLEQKEKWWFQRNKKEIIKWVKGIATVIGGSVLAGRNKIKSFFGFEDEENNTESKKEEEKKWGTEETAPSTPENKDSNTERTDSNTDNNTETPPEADVEDIDNATTPPEEKNDDSEKEPEMNKTDVKREVTNSLKSFKETAEGIDSNFSMITKNDKDIEADGKKLNAAYQKVMDELTRLNQLFPEDAEMQELYRATMYSLAEFYSDRSDIDNDHHEDTIKAVGLLTPLVNNIKNENGEPSQLPPMPTQDDLMQSIATENPTLAESIAIKIQQGLSMDQILADEEILKQWNEAYKHLFDTWEEGFDGALTMMYTKYKEGKYPGITPMQKKAFEMLKDIQGTNDRWDWKDRNVNMAKNIAGSVTAITAGIAVTILTAGLGTGAGIAIASVGAGALTTTVGMWANENKLMGGWDLALDFALNAIPFGLGKTFAYLRDGAKVATKAAKFIMASSYLVEWALDATITSGGQALKTGESFGQSLQDNIAWAIFPLVLHQSSAAMKYLKNSPKLQAIFARRDLADETLTEVNKAKMLAQLGKKQLSQEVLDKLNAKLAKLKRNETIKLLDEEAALVTKKEGLIKDIKGYIDENVVLNSKANITPIKNGAMDNFMKVGDKMVVENSTGVRKQITLLKFNGKDSLVSIDGGRTVKADLTWGRLNIADPIFKGETITGSFLAKHPNVSGKNITAMMGDLENVKVDMRSLKSLGASFKAFGIEMKDLSAIYPQLKRDITNLKVGESIDDFLGYKVTRTDKGFEMVDKSGHSASAANSDLLLNHILPAAEANGERLLSYKLAHFYRNNLTPDTIQSILQKNMVGRWLGKVKKLVGGKGINAYELDVDGVKYQVKFDKSVPEGIIFADEAGKAIAANSPIVRQLETKVFAKMSEKYKAFGIHCKDIQTPLGKLIPERMKLKMFKTIADKLHKPLTVIENMTVGQVIEAFQQFADAPTFGNFVRALSGGGGLNTMLLTGVIMIDATQNRLDEVGTDYIKYVLGGTLMPIVDIVQSYGEKKVEDHKADNTKWEDFTTDA